MRYLLVLLCLFSAHIFGNEYTVQSGAHTRVINYVKDNGQWVRTIESNNAYFQENYAFQNSLSFSVSLNDLLSQDNNLTIDASTLNSTLQSVAFGLARLSQMAKVNYSEKDSTDDVINRINYRVNQKIAQLNAHSKTSDSLYKQIREDIEQDQIRNKETLQQMHSTLDERLEALNDSSSSSNDDLDMQESSSQHSTIDFNNDFNLLSKYIDQQLLSLPDSANAGLIRRLNELSQEARSVDLESSSVIQNEALKQLYSQENGIAVPQMSKRDRKIVEYFESRHVAQNKQQKLSAKISSGQYSEDQIQRAQNALELSKDLSTLADEQYERNNTKDSSWYVSLATEVADIGLSLIPGVSLGKDVYELFTGKNLVTGEELSVFDRAMCAVGIVTVGGSHFAEAGFKLLGKATKIARKVKYEKALGVGKKIIGSARKLGLKAKEEFQLFTKLAGNNRGSVRFIDDFAESTKSVWNRLVNKGPNWTGSNIPKYFEVTADGEKFFVNPNATKHMNEYVSSYFRSTTHSAPIHSQMLLNSFEGSVKSAVKSGNWKKSMETGEATIQDGWELVFKKQRAGETLPVIKHARRVN